MATFHVWPLGSDYMLRAILIPFLILSFATIGVNVLVGYCGQISLGSGAFMAVGAYRLTSSVPVSTFLSPGWVRRFRFLRCLCCHRFARGLDGRIRGHSFRCAQSEDQGPVSGGRHSGRAVLFRLGFIRHYWFTDYSPSGSVVAPELYFFGLV